MNNRNPAQQYEANGKTEKKWTKIGAAFPHKEGLGFSIELDGCFFFALDAGRGAATAHRYHMISRFSYQLERRPYSLSVCSL